MSIKRIIRKGFFYTFIIWRDEIRKVLSDAGVQIFFLIGPLMYPILYSFMYNAEATTDVKMVVVDPCNSKESREFRRKMDATQDVKIVGVCANLNEAKEAVKEHDAYGILEIPRSFSKDIVRGKQTCVRVYSDMCCMLYYKAFLLAATNVSLDMNEDIQRQRSSSDSKRMQEISCAPLKYAHINYFNPKNGYASFLIPGVLILIGQQMMILGIGMAAGTDRDKNAYHELVPIQRSHLGTFRIVFGKALCYLMVWLLLAVYLLWLIPLIFNLPQVGNPFNTIAIVFPFLLSCIFFGMTCSVLIRDRESVFVVVVFTSVVLLFLSGLSWPQTAIPKFWIWVSYIFPSSLGIQGFVKVNCMGATIADVSGELIKMCIQVLVYFLTACAVYRLQVARSQRLFLRKERRELRQKALIERLEKEGDAREQEDS